MTRIAHFIAYGTTVAAAAIAASLIAGTAHAEDPITVAMLAECRFR